MLLPHHAFAQQIKAHVVLVSGIERKYKFIQKGGHANFI
jgi:hypothetical protein